MFPRSQEGAPKRISQPSSSVSSLGAAALLTTCLGYNSQIARAGDLDGLSIGTTTEVAGVNTVGRDQYSAVVIDGKTFYIDAEYGDAQIRVVDDTMTEGESIEVCGEDTFTWRNRPASLDIGEDGKLFASIEDLFGTDYFRLMSDASVDGDWSSCEYELKDFSTYDPESFTISYDHLTGKVDSSYWNGIDNDLLIASGSTYDSGYNDGAPGRCHGTDITFYTRNRSGANDIYVTNADATEHLSVVSNASYPRCQQDESTGEWVLSFSQLNADGDLDLYRTTLTLPGSTSEPVDPDADADGYPASVDCDDSDPNTYPGAPEYCNDIDNDCDGTADNNNPVDGTVYYVDNDRDGYGVSSAEGLPKYCDGDAPEGMSLLSGDCNDSNADMNPGAEEVCDSLDNDCNGSIDENDVCDEEEVHSASLAPGESIEIAGSSLSSAEDSEGDAHLSYDPETGTMTITLDSGAYVEGLMVTPAIVRAGLVDVPNTAEYRWDYISSEEASENRVQMFLGTSSTAMGFSTHREDARVPNTCELDEDDYLAQIRLVDRSLSEEGVTDSLLSINPDLQGWTVSGGIDLITQDISAGVWTEAMDSQECVEASTEEPINKIEDPKGGCSTASTPVSALALVVPFLAGLVRRRRTA